MSDVKFDKRVPESQKIVGQMGRALIRIYVGAVTVVV